MRPSSDKPHCWQVIAPTPIFPLSIHLHVLICITSLLSTTNTSMILICFLDALLPPSSLSSPFYLQCIHLDFSPFISTPIPPISHTWIFVNMQFLSVCCELHICISTNKCCSAFIIRLYVLLTHFLYYPFHSYARFSMHM